MNENRYGYAHDPADQRRDDDLLPDRERVRELAGRCDLALKIPTAPGFHLSNEDMKAITFALKFTAARMNATATVPE